MNQGQTCLREIATLRDGALERIGVGGVARGWEYPSSRHGYGQHPFRQRGEHVCISQYLLLPCAAEPPPPPPPPPTPPPLAPRWHAAYEETGPDKSSGAAVGLLTPPAATKGEQTSGWPGTCQDLIRRSDHQSQNSCMYVTEHAAGNVTRTAPSRARVGFHRPCDRDYVRRHATSPADVGGGGNQKRASGEDKAGRQAGRQGKKRKGRGGSDRSSSTG